MARIERQGSEHRILAETEEELALLAHARAGEGAVLLLEGLYRVAGQALLLPEHASLQKAQRVRRAFERAAAAHQEATQRRREFRLIKS